MDQKEVWNFLAESWRNHRNKPIKEVVEFLEKEYQSINISPGRILDVGCGTGRNLIAGFRWTGTDISPKMIEYAKSFAKRKGIDFTGVVADARNLPLDSDAYDLALCIAVLHCLDSERKKAVSEMYRTMKKGGRALIIVWNRRQPKFWFLQREIHEPWRIGDRTFYRYYYLFTKNELKQLLESAGFKIVSIKGSSDKAFKIFPKNIVAVAEK